MAVGKACLGLLVCLALVQGLPSPDPPRPAPFPPFPGFRRVSSGFFSTDPLTSVRRSFQDIQVSMGRGMRSLMTMGTALGHRMLGIFTRAPRLLSNAPLLFAPPAVHDPAPAPSSHIPAPAPPPGPTFPDFDDCDCHFGTDNLPPPKFVPISDNSVSPGDTYGSQEGGDTYGSPLAPPATQAEGTYGPPSPSSSPLELPPAAALDNSIHDLSVPDKVHEAVIHPGGGDAKEHLDVHKVEVLGAASVVQAPSAEVPDQAHPEKYMNFDTAWLDTVVHHNLWYKDTKAYKHHKHGEKLKVIPHLHGGQHPTSHGGHPAPHGGHPTSHGGHPAPQGGHPAPHGGHPAPPHGAGDQGLL